MPSNSTMIHKLQQALNMNGMRIMYSTSQFYSEQQDRPITIYHIKQAVWNDEKGKFQNVEVFKATSQIQIVKYLRDLWYTLNGWELPEDEEWAKIKAGFEGE